MTPQSSPRYLERIQIANFRAYGDSFTLSLPNGPGITLIHGPNGLGKTTFFDAVEWCLTGRVSRFDNYLTSAASRRAEHLTRFGAPENSHRVSLYFSGVSPIDRGLGAAPIDEEVVRVLKRSHWPDVSDLGLYLSLTHFLGQSATQRFSVKLPQDQWDALKGPAGVDRINHIRDRLGGPAAKLAFTRQIRSAEQELEQAEEAQGKWRGLIERLQRVRSLSRVRNAVSPDEVVQACRELILAVSPPDEDSSYASEQDPRPEVMLERARDAIGNAREIVRGAVSDANVLESLVDELDQIGSEGHSLDELLNVAVVQQQDHIQELTRLDEQLLIARANADSAHNQLGDAQTAIAHLLRLTELNDAYVRDVSRVASVSGEIDEIETQLRDIDVTHSELSQIHRELVSRAAAREELKRVVEEMRSAAQLARDIQTLKEQVERPVAGVDIERASGEIKVRRGELDSRREALRREIEHVQREFVEIERRTEVLVALANQIAGLLQEDDTACPVCASTFAPGELLNRIRMTEIAPPGSAQAAGDRLAAAHAELASVEQEIEVAQREMQRLDVYQRELVEIGGREAAILQRVRRLAPDASVASLLDVLRLADTYEQEFTDAQMIADGQRSVQGCQDEMRSLEAKRDEAGKRVRMLRSEAAKLSVAIEQARIALSARPDVWSEEHGLLARVQSDQVKAVTAAAAAQASVDSTSDALQDLEAQATLARERVAVSGGTIEQLQQKRSALSERAEQLLARWRATAPGLDYSRNTAWQLRTEAEDRERRVLEFEEQLERIVEGYSAWTQDAERQELEAALHAMYAEIGVTTEHDLNLHFVQVVENARNKILRLEKTRGAALRIAGELQQKADEYAHSVLEPLSEIIQSYSRALLTRADGSLFYRARYRANRSELRPGIIRQNPDGSAVPIDMNPNLYFSEGQMSALSVSSLLAASTTFRWSCWPALLMDDPLQHNDVIHASAFIDLLRRLVQKLHYQVIVSTHDSDQAEFILRKCESAGVDVQLCELRPAGGHGLVSG